MKVKIDLCNVIAMFFCSALLVSCFHPESDKDGEDLDCHSSNSRIIGCWSTRGCQESGGSEWVKGIYHIRNDGRIDLNTQYFSDSSCSGSFSESGSDLLLYYRETQPVNTPEGLEGMAVEISVEAFEDPSSKPISGILLVTAEGELCTTNSVTLLPFGFQLTGGSGDENRTMDYENCLVSVSSP